MNNINPQKDPPASQCRSSIHHLAQVVQVKLSLMIFKPYNFNSKDKLSDDKPSEDKLLEDKLLYWFFKSIPMFSVLPGKLFV